MTEPMKTAEQILFEIIGPLPVSGQRKWAAGLGKQYLIIKAMEAFAAQQVASERERIKKELGKSIIEHEYELDFPGDPVINVSVLFKLIDNL